MNEWVKLLALCLGDELINIRKIQNKQLKKNGNITK